MTLLAKHKSVDKSLKPTLQWLQSLPEVTKVVLGFSEACRHKFAPGSLRWRMDVDAGIKVNAYSGRGVTDVFIKVEPAQRQQLKEKIKARFA